MLAARGPLRVDWRQKVMCCWLHFPLRCTLQVVTRPRASHLMLPLSGVSLGWRVKRLSGSGGFPLYPVTTRYKVRLSRLVECVAMGLPPRAKQKLLRVVDRQLSYVFPERPCVPLNAMWSRFYSTGVIRVVRARIGTLCECTELIRNVRMK